MKKLAGLMILTAGILWGILGIFVRELNADDLASMDIVLIRAVTTTIILLPILFIRKKGEWKIRLRDIWCFIGTGIGSIVFFNFCYFKAVVMTSLSVAAVLLYTAPAFVIIISAFIFRERVTVKKVIALILTFLGLMLVTGILGSGSRLSAGGILFGLGAGLGYALYSIFSRFAIQRGYPPLTITFYTFLIAAISSAVMTNPVRIIGSFTARPFLLIPALLLGALCTVCPFALYTTGLQYTENGVASIIASIEPVASTVVGALIYGEFLSAWNAAGVVMVLSGVIISSLRPKKS
ncbi:MAG: EamA family transporter [Lachnospiraceae bacterium]|nr:EamA family transporter [Lachnospiraceae bacterium]